MVNEGRDFRLVWPAAIINFSFIHVFQKYKETFNNVNEEYVDSKVYQLWNICNYEITKEKWTKTKLNKMPKVI